MKKYLFLLLMLCLFMYACEQESITSELTTQKDELANRGQACDLTQIPLYIPPVTNVEGNIDFSAAFPVTKSTDYESSNNANLAVENISYSINEAPAESSFVQQNNTDYNLRISATYSNGTASVTDEFSIKFKVSNGQLVWESRNSCLYDDGESNELEIRTVQSVVYPD